MSNPTKKELEKLGSLKEFIDKKRISKSIKSISYSPAREKKLLQWLKENNSTVDAYKKYVYDKFNIKQYSNIQELRKALAAKGIDKEEIEIRVSEYKHRDIIIGSGQYLDFRTHQYKSNYIKMLKTANIDETIIANIKALDDIKFRRLVGLRDFKTDNTSKYMLPIIGQFDYHIIGIKANDKIKEIEEQIKNALEAANIPFNKNILANPIKFNPKETYVTLRATLERLFPSKVDYLNSAETEHEYKQRAFKLLSQSVDNGSKIYQVNSNGIKYLRFIGKDIPTSKNFTFVHDFIKYYNNRNK